MKKDRELKTIGNQNTGNSSKMRYKENTNSQGESNRLLGMSSSSIRDIQAAARKIAETA